MKFLILNIITQTATFRNPEFQNFHKSFSLPPPTTIIGFAGAALGLSAQASQEFFDVDDFVFGVKGISRGKAKDTWKYTNVTKGVELYNYHPDYSGSVITKEILFENEFLICFGTDSGSKFDTLHNAFLNPQFALTLGGSDSLAFLKDIIVKESCGENKLISNCIVEGDVIANVFSNIKPDEEFSIYENSEPISYDLPIRFNYKEDYGVRNVSKLNTFSFIGYPMQLNYKLKGVMFNNDFIPLCKL